MDPTAADDETAQLLPKHTAAIHPASAPAAAAVAAPLHGDSILTHTIANSHGSDGYTVQQALDTLGFGPWQALLLLYSGLFWASDAMEIMLLTYIGPAAQCEWGLSNAAESSLSSAVFAGMLVGACFWGAVADVLGRTRAGMIMAAVTFACGLLSAVAPTFPALVAARAGVGFGLSGTSTQYTLFMEWLPERTRGRWLVLFNIWWTLGTALEVGLAWTVLNARGWRMLVGLSAIPFGLLLLAIPFVPDSPKLMLARGDAARAHRLLSAAAKLNRKALPLGQLRPCPSDGPLHQSHGNGSSGSDGGSSGGSSGGGSHGGAASRAGAPRGAWGKARAAVALLWDDVCALLQDKAGVALALCAVWWCAAFTYYHIVMFSAELSALDSQSQGTGAGAGTGAAAGAEAGAGIGAGLGVGLGAGSRRFAMGAVGSGGGGGIPGALGYSAPTGAASIHATLAAGFTGHTNAWADAEASLGSLMHVIGLASSGRLAGGVAGPMRTHAASVGGVLRGTPAPSLCTGPEGQVQLPEGSFGEVLLSASAELPSLLFCMAAVGATPYARCPATARSFLAAAAALAPLVLWPATRGWALRLLLFAARFFAMSAFTVLYILTPEALPTRVRAFALGVCNATSRLGGLVAPFAAVALVQQGRVGASALAFVSACAIAAGAIHIVGIHTKGQELALARGIL